MRFNLFISFFGLLVVLSACAHENNPESLDARYDKCMSDPQCSTEERLQLMNEMADYLRYELRRMDRKCIDYHYEDCISIQSDDFEQWHKINNYMLDMMKSME
mgnify:CR=1 FL=1